MSDKSSDNPDKDGHEETEFDDKTAIRQEPNDDATAVRNSEARDPVLDEDEPDRGASDATIVRDDNPTAPVSENDSTILRDSPTGSGSAPPDGLASEGAPKKTSENATILRNAGEASSQNATILRASGEKPSNQHATILRGAHGPDDSTILKDEEAGEADSTILRDGDGAEDDGDRTVMNPSHDDDSTVLGGGHDKADTTYVATQGGGGRQKPKGNSEAGRLLKNRFVLEEKVGSGGMGDVYKALDLRQQEAQERNPYIAIKILNEEFARHKDAFISLQREATRTRGIPHPNIMAVYDFDREGDTVFMSMELLDGKPLDDYLRDHPEGVSIEDSWKIIDGICQGLSRAHGAGIVHSDFKPGNIYYTDEKQAKVFDFGIARAVSSPGDIKADGEKTVFDAGSLGALTPTYASYEMLVGKEPTKSDDVYAVALVAYELFTGRHPYNRTPADKAFERGLEPEPIPFLKRRHWRALKKGLALKGDDRYESIDQFYEDMFSEDAPVLRYAAIAAVLVASIGFGAYTYLFGGEVVPDEFTAKLGELGAVEQNLRDRLGAMSDPLDTLRESKWNFDSEDWRTDIRLNLNRFRRVEIDLQETFPELYAESEDRKTDESEKTANKIKAWQQRVLDVYLTEVDGVRLEAEQFADESVPDPPADADALARMQAERDTAKALVDQLALAEKYLDEAKRYYNFDSNKIDNAASRLGVEMVLATDELGDLNDDIAAEETRRKNEEEARLLAQQERQRIERRNATYGALRARLSDILKCKGDLENADLNQLNVVLNGPGEIRADGFDEPLLHQGMRGTFPEQFEVDKPGIVRSVVGCIQQRIAVRAPDRAKEVKSIVATYLPSERSISSIVIEDLDPCAKRTLEGRGNRNGSWCSDKLSVGGGETGPELVVLPPRSVGAPNIAISRIEIKRSDYNRYCEEVQCPQLAGPGTLPATNISLEQAQAYTRWLSDQTGRDYRLPTESEWLYAARTDENQEIDDNVNCTVDARGVRLGDTLLSSLSGRPNKWGLYNFVGNAREWAISDGEVVALGGAHTDPKSECDVDLKVVHSGKPDPVTGFRIVRSVEDPKKASDASLQAASSMD